MDFSEQYLSYEEYRALGGTLNQTPFNILEFEARKQIDLRTQNRLKDQTIPDEVKLCDFHLINKIESYAKTIESSNGNVASESIDGYSISYGTASQISEIIRSKNYELQDIMLNDLFGVIVNGEHIIFNGVK